MIEVVTVPICYKIDRKMELPRNFTFDEGALTLRMRPRVSKKAFH